MRYQPFENIKKISVLGDRAGSGKKDFYFEVLATDTTGKVFIKNEESFCHNLVSNNNLWSKPEMKPDNYIVDEAKGIRLHIRKNTEQADEFETKLRQVFVITANGDFDRLEAFRIPLLRYLKTLNFDSLYALEDQVSLAIAKSIYPDIYRVESFLRKYVIKFFAIKIGPEWWDLTADTEMQKKTVKRKDNETIFSEFVDNKVYLIDFGELGKLIYSQSSGNLNKDDIISKVMKLEDTVDALKKFKEEIQTNYNKFFKSTFKENNFQANWEELEKIRHKIAHNSLFTKEDQVRAQEVVRQLISTIDIANKEIDGLSFSSEDKEGIMRSVLDFRVITRDIFLSELSKSIQWSYEHADGFVGLQNFLINILGSKGYEFQSSRDVLSQLEKEGVIEVYSYASEKNERPVASVRFKKDHQGGS